MNVPQQVYLHAESDAVQYARNANSVVVRDADDAVVTVIEIVSPGNKDSHHAIGSFVRKAAAFLQAAVNLLIVNLFPPSEYDPQGIHKLIWDRIHEESFEMPSDKPLTVAVYSSRTTITGYVEPMAVGEELPDMPLFLSPDRYVPCPLAATYQASWEVFPRALKGPLES